MLLFFVIAFVLVSAVMLMCAVYAAGSLYFVIRQSDTSAAFIAPFMRVSFYLFLMAFFLLTASVLLAQGIMHRFSFGVWP
jgi:hypothetical protein